MGSIRFSFFAFVEKGPFLNLKKKSIRNGLLEEPKKQARELLGSQTIEIPYMVPNTKRVKKKWHTKKKHKGFPGFEHRPEMHRERELSAEPPNSLPSIDLLT